jgi:outer membrane receptor protein involved in Fe transport
MQTTPTRASLTRCCLILVATLLACPFVHAQAAPADAAALAKWDKNKNGKLDPEELAAMQADESSKSGTVLLNPFQVNTSKDRGYAAGNTLSGSRADTPLAITPASISVMTKEFIEDFAITDMNEAAAWTISMDPPQGGESGPFGGNRFQSNFRGAGNGPNFPSRNGALQYFVADSYSTERFEFSRGPSTALFGDGGAGGIQGSTSKQARLRSQSTSFTARVDSYGGYRATLDTNYGADKFALRLNLLHQEVKPFQDVPKGNLQNSMHIAGTYQVLKNTQIRAEFERSHEWLTMYRKTYGEQASIWNRTTVNNDNTAIANPGTFGLGQVSATNDYLVWNFGTNSLLNYKGNQYQTIGLGYQIPWRGRPDLPTNFKSGVSKEFFLGPADSNTDRDLNARGLYIETSFTPNLFNQLAYITSDVDPVQRNIGSLPGDYRIDVNRLLPTGAVNPNFGKAYSDVGGQSVQYQQDSVHEIRETLSYNFSVPKWWEMKQRFNLNTGWRQGIFEIKETSWRWANNPLQADLTNTVNQLRYRLYWDGGQPSINPVLPPSVPGFTFREIKINPANQARRSRTLRYGQLLSQTTFFNERLGFTGSFRRDNVKLKAREGITFDANYEPNMGNAGVVGATGWRNVYQNSESAGVVAYPFPQEWRWLRPVGVVANYSSNFEQVSRSTNGLIDGTTPPLTYAKTHDIGLRYSIPNGVAYGTLLYYKTDNRDILSAFGSAGDFRNIFTNLGYTDPALVSSSAFGSVQDTSDRKLEGWEAEFTANPSRNVTFTLNYAHPIVYTVSDSNGRRAFYAAHLAEFQAGAAARTGQVINGKTILDPAVIETAMQNIENSFNGFTAGTLTNGSIRHRVNLAGSYRFTEGMLKGLGLNAGVNYKGHSKAGSRDAQIKFNTTAPTVAQTAQAAYDYLWVDPVWATTAGANYTHRFGRYTARFQVNVTNLLDDDKPQYGQNQGGGAYSVINANQLTPNLAAGSPGSNPRMQVLSNFIQPDPRKFTFTTTISF